MYQVVKRDGKTVDFEIQKISGAIRKAFEALGKETGGGIVDLIAIRVTSDFQDKIKEGKVTVEEIQDSVEKVLSECGYADVAKAYILYRKQREKIRNVGTTLLDYKGLVDNYLRVNDWRVKENSTVTYSIGGLILNNSGAITANYWLSEVYDEEIAEAHRSGAIHLHDLSMLTAYCAGWNLKQLIQEGLGGIPGKITSSPANHLSTLCNQMVNFLGILQNEWAGAQAFSSFDTYLAPFVKVDHLSYDEVKQCIQSFIYGVNIPSRWGCVPTSTKILTPNGWKGKDELSVGDIIYTWVNGVMKESKLKHIIAHKNNYGVVHRYRGNNYVQTVTPEHRCIVSNSGKYSIRQSMDIFGTRESIRMPACIDNIDLMTCNNTLSDADVITAATEQVINDALLHLSLNQSRLYIESWGHQAEDDTCCYYDDEETADALEIIMLRAGYMPCRCHEKKCVCAVSERSVLIFDQQEIPYDGDVWCPNTDDGTAIFRDEEGHIFISGNCQAPFSNVTIDWTVPHDLENLPAIVGGKEMDFTYGDCQAEMDMINKAFIETMIEGDANGRGFQYPIPTYSITRDFNWGDTENNRLLFEMTAKYGTPYFSNYVNSDMEPQDIRSMCCRLRLSLRELRKKSGGYFGSGESTGSIGVVTINMPRIAYLASDEKDFYERLDRLMDISARSLKTKRTVVTQLLDQGLYPYTKRYLGHFNNHFSTIGLIGMNEVGLNAKWLKADLTNPRVQRFTRDVLNHMRERLSDYQEMYGDLYNLEATPAESTTYRFAKHDKEMYPDIITANMNGTPYYTNSSHLPVGYTEDIFSALDIQDELQTLYTSGTVFHGFLGEKLPDWKAAANLVRKIAENYRLPYYTISPTYSVCADHGYLSGEQTVCPICGKKTEVYSRITGYYRPVQNWNDGKMQEFRDRKVYDIGHSYLTHTGPVDDSCEEIYEVETESSSSDEEIILFKTETCPNCRAAMNILDRAGVSYRAVVASNEPDLARSYGVKLAPTLIVAKGDEVERYRGVSEIKGWLANNR